MTRTVTYQLEIPIPDLSELERALWVVVALSLVADVATTMYGIHVGLAESNPVARSAMEGWGVAGLVALKTVAIAMGTACRPLLPARYRPIVPAGLALPWVFATTVNAVLIATVI